MTAEFARNVPENIGSLLYALARDLFPLNRSITGQGVRDTLSLISETLPLEILSMPTGKQVFDWTIPKEWNLKEAYIEDPSGNRIVEASHSNLHVVGYSKPVNTEMTLSQLRPHLHTLPDHPDWIPYRTSYYKETWGFCLRHRQLQDLTEGTYRVRIDATLEPGVLNLGEAVIHGETTDEVLISAHVCHPSLCNDNLSGIAIAAYIGQQLLKQRPRYTYRFIFAPGTIGAISWLATHMDVIPRVKHGMVLALLGRPAPLTYKKSRNGSSEIDQSAAHVLQRRNKGDRIIDFSPWGYDERQYNSPGIALNVGRLTRDPEGSYPEYHTSADNLELVTELALEESFKVLCEILDVIERDGHYENKSPLCEPQLGKYGLYDDMGGASSIEAGRLALLWTLNLSDGSHSLLEIAERSGLSFDDVYFATDRLERANLLERRS